MTTVNKIEKDESIEFECTIGVTEGYFHNNENASLELIQILKQVCLEIEAETGIYVSFVINPCKVLYKEEWGCPKNGEDVYVISAVYNPYFKDLMETWIKSCELIQRRLKTILNQSTFTSVFREVKIRYLHD